MSTHLWKQESEPAQWNRAYVLFWVRITPVLLCKPGKFFAWLDAKCQLTKATGMEGLNKAKKKEPLSIRNDWDKLSAVWESKIQKAALFSLRLPNQKKSDSVWCCINQAECEHLNFYRRAAIHLHFNPTPTLVRQLSASFWPPFCSSDLKPHILHAPSPSQTSLSLMSAFVDALGWGAHCAKWSQLQNKPPRPHLLH